MLWTDDKLTWPLRNAALLRQADTFAGALSLLSPQPALQLPQRCDANGPWGRGVGRDPVRGD